MSDKTEVFRLEHISKVFQGKGTSVKAVDDVSFSIGKGEIFGIIGMSGAGKSTLVRTLNRLEKVTEGTVYFEGQNLNKLSAKELQKVRQSIGMIFQGFNLLMQKTVIANVMLPMKIAGIGRQERKERAYEMLRLVGLEDKAQVYPSALSGGQKQRVAIARALSMNPQVLLCDEATSALDPKITEEILNLLKEINEKMKLTIVIITHEMSVVEKICDKVAIIDSGKLAEIGLVEDIFTNPQTEAAKHLVFPAKQEVNPFDMRDRRCVRIVFDGHASTEPVISNLVQETGEKVNILCANTKSVNGLGFGQMIVELPKEHQAAETVLQYLKKSGVFAAEIKPEEVE
ncbi:MAG: ATP-binding cassette domain-containing protein [Butyribacter sp.]|nr:ATP-binding cassette domain-containing protein [bacterium]MDY3854853.1 ATP-binding cassette domain-containing protein [Butyribacter sp.]